MSRRCLDVISHRRDESGFTSRGKEEADFPNAETTVRSVCWKTPKGEKSLYGLYARQSVEKQDSISVEVSWNSAGLKLKGRHSVHISTEASAEKILEGLASKH